MALPIINAPTYELVLPSTKEKITYRPFLVKEEKILLIAMEDGEEATIIRAVRQIVNNCTFEKLDPDIMATFDLEYVFLNIRAKSVGEVATLNLLSPDDDKTYVKVEIPLDKVKVKFTKGHSNNIKLTDDISVEMRYPTFEMLQESTNNTTENVFSIVAECVERIFDGEDIYERVDFTKDELDAFLDSLGTKQFQEVQNFFETMPKLSHDVTFINPETKKENTITLEGMQSFFV
jgi:hypothetical protein